MLKVLKNALCFIMGYFVATETYFKLLLLMHVLQCRYYWSINVCTNFEINLYNIDEFRKYVKSCFI